MRNLLFFMLAILLMNTSVNASLPPTTDIDYHYGEYQGARNPDSTECQLSRGEAEKAKAELNDQKLLPKGSKVQEI